MESSENAATQYFDIQIADRIIRVYPLTPNLVRFCRDYIVPAEYIEYPEDADNDRQNITVHLTWEDIIYERELAEKEGLLKQASDPYLETLALARKVAENLLNFDILLFHASCIALDGEGYCFAAPSGVGKSTHARLWKDMLGDRVTYINDDKPFLKIDDTGVTAYGSPWDGGHHLSSNKSVPVRAVYLLKRGEDNSVKDITADEAYPFLLGQVYRPHAQEALKKILSLVDRLSKSVKLFSLQCNTEPEAAMIVFEKIDSCQ